MGNTVCACLDEDSDMDDQTDSLLCIVPQLEVLPPLQLPDFENSKLDGILADLVKVCKNIFSIFDRKKEDRINMSDYIQIMRTLAKVWRTPKADPQIFANFQNMDRLGNKYLTFDEFFYPKLAFVNKSYNRDVRRAEQNLDDEREKWEESEYTINSLLTSSKLLLRNLQSIYPPKNEYVPPEENSVLLNEEK